MLGRQISASAPDNPFDQFFGTGGSGGKMSGHHRRCAASLLKGLLTALQQAGKPFNNLRQTSLAKMTVVDKARYEKACKHFEELADSEAEKAAEFPD
jgi:hypothetical protein